MNAFLMNYSKHRGGEYANEETESKNKNDVKWMIMKKMSTKNNRAAPEY